MAKSIVVPTSLELVKGVTRGEIVQHDYRAQRSPYNADKTSELEVVLKSLQQPMAQPQGQLD